MKVLSFDCGHESLGICITDIDFSNITKIYDLITPDFMDTIMALTQLNKLNTNDRNILINHVVTVLRDITDAFDEFIKIDIVASVQLVTGVREAGLLERASAVGSFLNTIQSYCNNPDIVLIEDQTINSLSGEVASQVALFYSTKHHKCKIFPKSVSTRINKSSKSNKLDKPQIILMNPKYKNYVRFTSYIGIEHFYTKYVSLYEANKNHTKANFLHWMSVMTTSVEYTCKYSRKNKVGIQSKRKRDMADAFMQTVAYVLFCYVGQTNNN